MSWAHWSINNCLGTLASQHCNNTLFKMGVQNLGCYNNMDLKTEIDDLDRKIFRN